MVLSSFERSLERMVDGVFGRAFKSSVKPVELGRRMLREMDDHRNVDVKGRTVVPNAFTFRISAADHAQLADVRDALTAELADAAREYAADEGYWFMGPVQVAVVVNDQLKPGRFELESHLQQSAKPSSPATPAPAAPPPPAADSVVPSFLAPAAPAAPAPAPAAAAAEAAVPASLWATSVTPPEGTPVVAAATNVLYLPDGTRLPLGTTPIVLGRHPDCDVVLHDANVSRRHAEIRPSGSTYAVTDLHSTNGTKVNGVTVGADHPLRAGDVLTLGSAVIRFEAA